MCLGAPFARDQHRGTVRRSGKRRQGCAAVRDERRRSCYLTGSANSAGNSVRRVTSGGDNVSQMGCLEMEGSNLEQMLQGAIECRRVLQNRRSQGTGGRARLQPRRTVRVEKWVLALVRSMAKAIDGSGLLRRAEETVSQPRALF